MSTTQTSRDTRTSASPAVSGGYGGEHVRVERRGRVLVARLHSPPHALMTLGMMAELDALVRRADSDDEVGAVVFTGTQDEVFLTHFDVSELLQMARSSPAVSERQAAFALRLTRRFGRRPRMAALLKRTPLGGLLDEQRFHDTLIRMGRSGTVYLCAINGATAGGGVELALACDVRLLSDRGEMAQPEVLLGFPPGGGGTQRMARLIGRAAALEIMLTGRSLSPTEAKDVGLVHHVVAHDELLETACAQAEILARRYKPAVSSVKRLVLDGASLPLEGGLQAEQAGFIAMLGHRRSQDAMAAYVDAIKTTGTVPAYDPPARQKLQDGTFVPFQ